MVGWLAAITALVGLVTLVLTWWIKREKRTPMQQVFDSIAKKEEERSKLTNAERDLSDYERRKLLDLRLRSQKYKNNPK